MVIWMEFQAPGTRLATAWHPAGLALHLLVNWEVGNDGRSFCLVSPLYTSVFQTRKSYFERLPSWLDSRAIRGVGESGLILSAVCQGRTHLPFYLPPGVDAGRGTLSTSAP